MLTEIGSNDDFHLEVPIYGEFFVGGIGLEPTTSSV